MILDEICAHKHEEVKRSKEATPLAELQERIKGMRATRPFRQALREEGISLIAEVKRASPSKGDFRTDINPVQLAGIYELSGARAISVLTDQKYFKGSLDDLVAMLQTMAPEVKVRDVRGPSRMPIDRVFSITGFGMVATGTLVRGALRVGDDVEILPQGFTARVRGLQSHGVDSDEITAAKRVAVNLQRVSGEGVGRGFIIQRLVVRVLTEHCPVTTVQRTFENPVAQKANIEAAQKRVVSGSDKNSSVQSHGHPRFLLIGFGFGDTAKSLVVFAQRVRRS